MHYLFEHLPDNPRHSSVLEGRGHWDTQGLLPNMAAFAGLDSSWGHEGPSSSPSLILTASHTRQIKVIEETHPMAWSEAEAPKKPKNLNPVPHCAGQTQSIRPWQLQRRLSPSAVPPMVAHPKPLPCPIYQKGNYHSLSHLSAFIYLLGLKCNTHSSPLC